MPKQIMTITWKELKIFFKDPGLMAWMFFQPFLLLAVLSFATGGAYGDRSKEGATQALAVNQNRGRQAAATLEGLDARVGFVEFVSPVRVARAPQPGSEGQKTPNAFQQHVPGVTVYGVFWIVFLLAGSVFQEKREAAFRRRLAPMSRAAMLAGKVLPYYLISLLLIATLMGLSRLLFGVSLGHSAAGLLAVSLAAAATATGLGVLLAGMARSEAQVGMLTAIAILALAVLGGCFIPRGVMPDWLRTLGLITPHAWAVDAYQDLMVQGNGLWQVLPKTGALATFAAAFFGLGVWRFRFE
jgi:ABC-2 type transport system permease protein